MEAYKATNDPVEDETRPLTSRVAKLAVFNLKLLEVRPYGITARLNVYRRSIFARGKFHYQLVFKGGDLSRIVHLLLEVVVCPEYIVYTMKSGTCKLCLPLWNRFPYKWMYSIHSRMSSSGPAGH